MTCLKQLTGKELSALAREKAHEGTVEEGYDSCTEYRTQQNGDLVVVESVVAPLIAPDLSEPFEPGKFVVGEDVFVYTPDGKLKEKTMWRRGHNGVDSFSRAKYYPPGSFWGQRE